MLYIHTTVKRIVHGSGCIKNAPAEARRLGGTRALIVTDPGIAKAGVQKPLEDALEQDGIPWSLYDQAELEPTVDSIASCAAAAKDFKADVIFGIGGGSALDTTKAAAVLLTNDGPISQYFGMDKVPLPLPPVILVPTTAGTGSEMTSISVLADTKKGGKWGVVSDHMYADAVLLDPELTLGLPPAVTAMTGIDAFVHAMESYVNLSATPFTEGPDLHAMLMISGNLRQAYTNGRNPQAREAMLYASSICGMGFSNTQNGVIHAIGMAVPATYHLPHGLLMAACAPMGIAFNCHAAPEKYGEIAEILGCDTRGKNVFEAAEMAVEGFTKLMRDVDIEPGLKAYGVKEEDIRGIAERAAASARLMDNNPRQATADQLEALIREHF